MLSHHYLARQGSCHATQFAFRTDDVLYCPFPLFHIDAATLTVIAALAVGCTAAHCQRVAPAFMVPRYIEFIDQLPKTPTEKVEKHTLKNKGNTAATFDAQHP